jgi:hypothetical protein
MQLCARRDENDNSLLGAAKLRKRTEYPSGLAGLVVLFGIPLAVMSSGKFVYWMLHRTDLSGAHYSSYGSRV